MGTLKQLSKKNQIQWRKRHIPHRIRAALPGLPMQDGWLIGHNFHPDINPVWRRCSCDSIFEGRLAAMRWLIDFLGVRPRKDFFPSDVRAASFVGVMMFKMPSAKAKKLVRVWKGCTQATSHPTHASRHPKVNEPELAEALHIVIEYLEGTIYLNNKTSLRDLVMRAEG